jgi:amidohydrolase
MELKHRILKASEAIFPELVKVRRHLHMHPELSYQEYETSAFISEYLNNLGIEHQTGVAGTGIVGVIHGTKPGKGLTIGLRADMDALPVTEAATKEYRSKNEGVMHACGHDSHISMLLGTATLLNNMRNKFSGTVILVFQPGEEKAPGGAKLMIESGVFDRYNPDIFLAQHVLPELPSGVVGFHQGPYMASCDEMYITVAGKGGHTAQPSQYTDQIYIASEVVISLKDTISAMSQNNAPTIFAIGRISGAGATNVIPEKVEIAGTFRTFDEKWRQKAKGIIKNIASDIGARRNVSIEVNIVEGYPVLFNNEALTLKAMELSRTLMGDENVMEMPVRMSSEDFSFFSVKYPSCLFRLGISSVGQPMRLLHTPTFDIDERAMVSGVSEMTWLVMNLIGQ